MSSFISSKMLVGSHVLFWVPGRASADAFYPEKDIAFVSPRNHFCSTSVVFSSSCSVHFRNECMAAGSILTTLNGKKTDFVALCATWPLKKLSFSVVLVIPHLRPLPRPRVTRVGLSEVPAEHGVAAVCSGWQCVPPVGHPLGTRWAPRCAQLPEPGNAHGDSNWVARSPLLCIEW